jgi:60 kDa SS-A/Ro ribonucleoprotein
MRYASLINQPVPQTQPLNKRQVVNNAGGFVFQIDIWSRLNRFLILGSDSNTYYQKAADLTRENAACVQECYDQNPVKTIDEIVSVSIEGRAPKNDPAIFALAIGACHTDVKVRQLALGAMPAVCRTSTHLFQFVKASKALGRGWGRAMKRAVGNWYNNMPVDSVAYQVIKYREREGYTHKRLMQTAHPDPGSDKVRIELYKWIWGKEDVKAKKLPNLISAFETSMKTDTSKKERLTLVQEMNLPWEALPTECNADPDYWTAMLPKMGVTALIRNLGNMSRIGVIKPLSAQEKLICERLNNEEDLRKSRVHPFNILYALKTYASGKGFRGSNSWEVSRPVVSALDKAFYKTFKNVEPTGKRYLFGLDVSGSMSSSMGGSNVSCCEATAALSLVTANVEPQTHIMGFASTFKDLGIGAGDTLEAATRKAYLSNFGSTDCSLPMTYALSKEIPVDVFVVMTDNETYHGRVHPTAALLDYRKKMKIDAKLIVVGMTATNFSIADPQDAGMLDVAGFDASVPAVMADFARR